MLFSAKHQSAGLSVISTIVLIAFLGITFLPSPFQTPAPRPALASVACTVDPDGIPSAGCTPPPVPASPPSPCGSILGQAGVSCTGAGTYDIPIEVPPGSADMQPALALTYNSQAGNGLLGMGWSINGLSTITRCAANVALDNQIGPLLNQGYKGGINYDENDRFCLDGQRLIPIAPFGGAVQEYRTEPDTFARVKSYGTTLTGADYFTAEAKSGLVTEYGKTPDSRIKATDNPAIRVWAANKLTNSVGNYIEYSYNAPSTGGIGDYSPTEIRYTGNTAAGVLPYNSVKFGYELRDSADTAPFYQGGSVVKAAQVLSSITTCLNILSSTCTGANLVSRYDLQYQQSPATRRYQLKYVQKCDRNDICLPPTTMTWSDDGVTNLAGNTTSGSGGTKEWNSANFADTDTSFQKSDAPIYYDAFVTSVKGIANAPDAGSAVLGSLSLASQLYSLYSNPFAAPLYIVKQFIEYFYALFTDRYWIAKGKLGDVDGDGRIDIVGFAKQGDSKNRPEHVWLSNKLASGENEFHKIDDWKTNELRQDTDLLRAETTEADEAKLADFDGDGLMDVLSFEEKNNTDWADVYAYFSDGVGKFEYNGMNIQNVGPNEKKAIGHSALGDFNGDGKPDFARFTEKASVFGHIYLNQGGNTFKEQPDWGLCQPFGINCKRADNPLNNILIGDVNGDDKTDIVVLSEVDNGFGQDETHATIWLTNKDGNNWAPNPEVFDFDYDFNSITLGANVVQPGDFNGDGKMDLSVFRPDSNGFGAKIDTNNSGGIDNDDMAVISTVFRVYLSTGKTFVFQSSFSRDLFSPQSDSTGGNAAFATDNQKFIPGYYVEGSKVTFLPRLSDYNGDGKTDVMIFDANDRNYAHLWLSDGTKLRHDPTLGNTVNTSNYGIVWGSLFGKVDQVMVGDVDGDGRSDVVSFARKDYPIPDPNYPNDVPQYDGQINVTLSNSYPFPDLMTRVTDGFGKKDEFEYKPLTDDSVYKGHTPLTGFDAETYNFRGPLYVVSEHRTSDGIGGLYQQDYTYYGAKSHRSYGFLGFFKIVIADPQTSTTETLEYEQRYPLICRLKSRVVSPLPTDTQQPSIVLSEHTFAWSVSATVPHVIKLESETDIQYEVGGAKLSHTSIDYVYDVYNNVIKQTTSWPDVPNTTAEAITTTYQVPTTWILDRPTSTKVERSQPVPVPARVVNRTFDPQTGLLTSSTEMLQAGRTLKTEYLNYDKFGNPTKVIVSGTDIATRTTDITYDAAALGRFPTAIKNTLGQTTSLVFGAEFGQIMKVTDPNLLPTAWKYDTFGRETNETRPDITTTQTGYFCPEYSTTTTPAHAVYWIQRTMSGAPNQTTFFDERGREVRTSTVGFDGKLIYVDSAYDPALRLSSVSQPYYETGPSFNTAYTYDIKGRVVKQVAPNGAQTTLAYSGNTALVPPPTPFTELTNPPRLLWHQVTATNALGEKTDYIINRLDQVNQVVQRDTGNTLISHLTYSDDAFNNPLKVADENNNITTRTYVDNRLVSLVDPDTGTTSYTYDVLGNLKTMKDAKTATGNTVTLSYDPLDRLILRKDKLEGLSTWKYDTALVKGIGRLTQTSDDSTGFIESYAYDLYGRPLKTTTTIPGEAPLVTERVYDTAGRVLALKYPGPNSFAVKNVYNANGYLSEVRNYTGNITGPLFWQANSLNAAGQVTQQTQGNTTTGTTLRSTFAYDKMFNLTDLKQGDAIGTTVPINPLKRLTYKYNSVNSLTEQRNLIRATSPAANKDYVDQFEYDPLNRLTRKNSSMYDYIALIDAPRDDLKYKYNAIGNITKKSDLSTFDPNYSYSPALAGPHAVTGVVGSLAGFTFTYDANGNMTTGQDFKNNQSRSINWYSYNKPSQINETGKSLALTYDSYRDKIKQVLTGTTAKTTEYIGSIYEKAINSPGPTEHKYYVYGSAAQPVAMYTTRTSSPFSDVRYLHYDNLGSLDLITNETGGVVEDLSFDPHGLRRKADWTVATNQVPSLTAHGFTNQEHLDDFGLIDMKGRVYDPKLGRFISADPYITNPFLTENANRYSYVHNSSTNFIDPTGFQIGWEGLDPLAQSLWPTVGGVAGTAGAGSLLFESARPAGQSGQYSYSWAPATLAPSTIGASLDKPIIPGLTNSSWSNLEDMISRNSLEGGRRPYTGDTSKFLKPGEIPASVRIFSSLVLSEYDAAKTILTGRDMFEREQNSLGDRYVFPAFGLITFGLANFAPKAYRILSPFKEVEVINQARSIKGAAEELGPQQSK